MIDIKKKYRTRSGRAVTLRFTDGLGDYPVMGYVHDVKPVTAEWMSDGRYFVGEESAFDLVEIPEEKTVELWVNIHDHYEYTYRSEKDAREYAGHNVKARKKVTITYVEGEGL